MAGKSKRRQLLEQDAREAIQIALGAAESRYVRAFDTRAHGYALIGHSNEEIAELLGIQRNTFAQWIVDHPSLAKALNRARHDAHVAVVKAMHRNAKGFKAKETKVNVVQGKLEKTDITKAYPPNQQAAAFLLMNRKPDHWQDRKSVEHSGRVSLSALLQDLHKTEPKVIEAQPIEPAEEPEEDC